MSKSNSEKNQINLPMCFKSRSVMKIPDCKNTELVNKATIALVVSTLSKYDVTLLPIKNGGFAIKMIPQKTIKTFNMSTRKIGSLRMILAKKTVNKGEVAAIIITSAKAMYWKVENSLNFHYFQKSSWHWPCARDLQK